MAANRYQSALLQCQHCNARGVITWDGADGDASRTLVGVAGDFHIETGRTGAEGTMIVCSQCDEIHDASPAGRDN